MVQVPSIMRLSPATGRVDPFHLAGSEKFPGPVNVFVAANTSEKNKEKNNTKSTLVEMCLFQFRYDEMSKSLFIVSDKVIGRGKEIPLPYFLQQ